MSLKCSDYTGMYWIDNKLMKETRKLSPCRKHRMPYRITHTGYYFKIENNGFVIIYNDLDDHYSMLSEFRNNYYQHYLKNGSVPRF